MKRVAIYCRVSTDDQNIETQLFHLREYCQRSGYEIAGEYVDKGFSGKTSKRPKFESLLADMRANKFDCILCHRLDRIGRSLQHLLNLFEEFRNSKIGFISLSQNIDSSTPEGRMFLRMLMVLSEYERELIVSRTREGLTRAVKQGKKLGRPKGSKDKKKRRKSGYYQRWGKL